jgi:phage/plasmid primase-like uncharacterized protein
MGLCMDALTHRIAIAQRFGSRIAAGDAVFQSPVSGIQGVPCTLSPDGDIRSMTGVNLFVLMQVMKDRSWADPRFFTAAQAEKAGWSVAEGATGVALRYFNSTGADGLPLDKPTSSLLRVYNASEIEGVPVFERSSPIAPGDLVVAVERTGVAWIDTDGLNLAVHNWIFDLQKQAFDDGMVAASGMALRAKLAVALLEAQVGPLAGNDSEFGRFAVDWVLEIEADPLSFFDAANDAERLAAEVMVKVREVAVARDGAAQVTVLASTPVVVDRDAFQKESKGARATARFSEREAVLAVPFTDKERVKTLGAQWYGSQKLWFVPKGMDVGLFKEWNPRENALGAVATHSVLLESFKDSMALLGLDTSDVQADGKWHYTSVDTKRKKINKSGSYIVNLGDDGSSPVGTIINRDSGESFTWRHQGELLTPEQRAKMRAESLAREAVAIRAAALIQDAAAGHAAEIWAAGRPADGHAYVVSKEISAEGLRQISGSVLLGYPEYKGESGGSMVRGDKHYLLVPMQSEVGEFRAVQAIAEDGTKIFMKGAQKKGTMMVLGADCFDDVVDSKAPAVAYVEGVATGASFRAISGLPVVVCFDAGNLETVVAQTAKAVAGVESMLSVVAGDNDQFHVERAVGYLAEKLGLNPVDSGGYGVAVVSGSGETRRVGLGEVVVDGQWHETAKGTYCASLEMEVNNDAVRRVAVEVVPTGGRAMRATFENRGVEAGRTALAAIVAAGGRGVAAVPRFESVVGRPTDWNDLVKREGVVLSRNILKEVEGMDQTVEKELVLERSTLERGRVKSRGIELSR